MRIRQLRPEFFTDPVTAHLRPEIQVTYLGLWCIADDAGYLRWDVEQIGALLYPYMSVRVRERRIEEAGRILHDLERVHLHTCGCAVIPTLEKHQRIGGNRSFPIRDMHLSIHVRTSPAVTVSNVTVSNGKDAPDASGAGASNGRDAALRVVSSLPRASAAPKVPA